MKSGLDVVAHPTGPWLVRAGKVLYAVPPALARPLLPWRGRRPGMTDLRGLACPEGIPPEDWRAYVEAVAAALAGREPAPGRCSPPLWLRLPLVPAGWVRVVALHLAPLASRRGVGLLLVIGAAGYLHLGLATTAAPITSGTAAVAIVLFVLTALAHEFGHAAALARGGYPPGGFGAGLLWVVPVLFADVSAVGALPPRARLAVDLAGILFQFAGGGLIALGVGAIGPAASAAAWLALGAVAWSLFPFVRSDGYWVVSDLLGVDDLESGPAPAGAQLRMWLLRVYRLLNAAFLALVAVVLPLRFVGPLRSVLAPLIPEAWRLPGALVGAALLLLVWWRLARRIRRLVGAAFRSGAPPQPGCSRAG